MRDCIFCKIVKGEIPCYQIYEDKDFLGFLDVNPKSEGHMLVIPKKHYENIFDISGEVLRNLIATAQKMAKKLKELPEIDGVNILHASGESAQQSVFHFHLHLVPRRIGDDLDLDPKSDYKTTDLGRVQKKFKFGI